MWFIILFLWGLYEQHKSTFFIPYFNIDKKEFNVIWQSMPCYTTLEIGIRRGGKNFCLPYTNDFNIYLKVCNVLGKILYSIRKYFVTWDVHPQEKKWSEKRVFGNDLESGCFWQAIKTKRYRIFVTKNYILLFILVFDLIDNYFL